MNVNDALERAFSSGDKRILLPGRDKFIDDDQPALHRDEEITWLIDEIKKSCEKNRRVIITGLPGTGKTFLLKKACDATVRLAKNVVTIFIGGDHGSSTLKGIHELICDRVTGNHANTIQESTRLIAISGKRVIIFIDDYDKMRARININGRLDRSISSLMEVGSVSIIATAIRKPDGMSWDSNTWLPQYNRDAISSIIQSLVNMNTIPGTMQSSVPADLCATQVITRFGSSIKIAVHLIETATKNIEIERVYHGRDGGMITVRDMENALDQVQVQEPGDVQNVVVLGNTTAMFVAMIIATIKRGTTEFIHAKLRIAMNRFTPGNGEISMATTRNALKKLEEIGIATKEKENKGRSGGARIWWRYIPKKNFSIVDASARAAMKMIENVVKGK
jgi:SpoVK/Ycf46/Vps4 family AAA+-type ATPase